MKNPGHFRVEINNTVTNFRAWLTIRSLNVLSEAQICNFEPARPIPRSGAFAALP